jgi:hypothetical protein
MDTIFLTNPSLSFHVTAITMRLAFAITLATLFLTMTGSNGEEESPRELQFRPRVFRTRRPIETLTRPPSRVPATEQLVGPDAVTQRPIEPRTRPPSRFPATEQLVGMDEVTQTQQLTRPPFETRTRAPSRVQRTRAPAVPQTTEQPVVPVVTRPPPDTVAAAP